MEQFIQKWRCIVVRELDSGSRNESLLQLGRFLANLFVDKWAASDPQYLCFAELDRFEGSDCFITSKPFRNSYGMPIVGSRLMFTHKQ